MFELINISKAFEKMEVFKCFSCSVPEKGITVLKGASGSGKTTLARIIAGLETADNGRITGLQNKRISFMFQEDRLFPHMTALENASVASSESIARSILTVFGMADDLDKTPDKLSGGMCRRVSLARALAYGGDLIILDEPFKGLDKEIKNIVFSVIKDFSKTSAILIITHDNEDFGNADNIVDLTRK